MTEQQQLFESWGKAHPLQSQINSISRGYGEPTKHTLSPTVTGTSVLGLRCSDGVIIAADTLGSYGSMARFMNVSRLHQAGSHACLGASGDYADFQQLKDIIDDMVIADKSRDDGHVLKPRSIFAYLGRLMYSKRSRFEPLWNALVFGGFQDGKPFLGFEDKIGVCYEDQVISTGFGQYLGAPLLREKVDEKGELTVAEGKELINNVLRVLNYRDARSFNRYEMAIVTEKGVEVSEPYTLDTNWEVGTMFTGYE
eukprot:Clim_evm91s108 gene=Clim_evmTU91s108